MQPVIPTLNQTSIKFMLLLAVITIAGCSDRESWQAVTYPVSGTMMINGNPAEAALVLLEPANGFFDRRQSRPWASVTSSGDFNISTYKPGDGAPEGEFKILLVWPTHGTLEQKDRLNGKYGKPENPYSVVTIKAGKNQLPPIDLKNVSVQ